MKTFLSDISKKEFPISEKVSAQTIRYSILSLIQKENPHFSHDSYLSLSELNSYREKAVAEYLAKEVGELTDLEKTVLSSVTKNKTLSDKISRDKKKKVVNRSKSCR